MKIIFAFLLILGASYYVVATSLIGVVGDSLFDEYQKQDLATGNRLATQVSPLYSQAASETLQTMLDDYSKELNTRILITDESGKLQFDSDRFDNGKRCLYPEVAKILNDGEESSYGIHSDSSQRVVFDLFHIFSTSQSQYYSVCATSLKDEADLLGTVITITSVQEMMNRVFGLLRTITMYFCIAAIAALIFSYFFSGLITRPIAALIKSIKRMSQGDFSTRVPSRGGGEIRKLSDAFNMMSEKLEMLDQSRNQFVSNASHELKTPLATMKILLESIIYQPDMETEIRNEFLTDINKEIDRLSSIVGDLLTLVSMDSKTMRLNKTTFNLAQLVLDNVHRLDLVVKKRKQEMILQLNDRCDITADSSKLAQVIYNLAENASKYSPDGSVIRIRLIRSGRSAILTVSDNGPGIPKADQAHIFDRFYRVDKARSRETGGTGLGLSIVHQMVLMHGGTVSVESEEGKGSVFTVELPIE